MASKLTSLGIKVEGTIEEFDEEEDYSSEDDSEEEEELSLILPPPPQEIIGELFLDITCMVAYVSSMTNGDAEHNFRRPFYRIQAEQERVHQVKPELDDLFNRHANRLVTCQSALTDFQGLVDTISDPQERQCSLDLIQRLRKLTSSCKPRSRVIFGTADNLRLAVVTYCQHGFYPLGSQSGT